MKNTSHGIILAIASIPWRSGDNVVLLVGAFSELQAQGGISVLLPLCAIPFVVGLLTGITVAFVGVGIPIFLHLLKDNLNLVFLFYLCGFAGVLLSPTYLCLIVTRDYFKADLLRVYRRLLPLVAGAVAIGFLISYLKGIDVGAVPSVFR